MNGKLIIFSAPSGAGKTTIVKKMLEQIPSLEFSISACSRTMRKGETDGVDYFFLTPETFRIRIENSEFVEWEEVYAGNYYGTLKDEVERIWAKGSHVIFDVDVKGGLKLKSIFGERALSIFVMPPSVEVLKARLECRSTESEETLKVRLAKAEEEISHAPQFDQILINDDLATTIGNAKSIVTSFIQ